VLATKPREIAVNLLRQREEHEAFIETLLNEALDRCPFNPLDKALVRELVLGVVRWQIALDWLIDRKTTGRPPKPGLRILLRLGLYQMFWLDRIPAYAAVNETVQLARQTGFTAQAGFVNAVLRAYGRELDPTRLLLDDLKKTHPWLGYSHPHWLYERWNQRWDAENTSLLMAWNNGPASTYARINSLRTATTDLLPQWDLEKIKTAPCAFDWTGTNLVFELLEHPPLDTLPSFKKGAFYVQDPSTLLAVHLLNPQPGEQILDACAAPGGKTTLIAQFMNNRGRIVAEDTDETRIQRLESNCRRLGVTCVHTRHIPLSSDTASPTPSPSSESTAAFDRALVDVPCSNTGVMRRRVELRWRLRLEEIQRLSRIQFDLLLRASRRLKPGATLVYSTCSLESEENEQLVRKFLTAAPDYVLHTERQLIPFRDGTDGAYVARFQRKP